MLLPAVQRSRESARRIECVSHLHQIGLALHQYHSVHGVFPSVWGSAGSTVVKGKPVTLDIKLHSLLTQILPYLDQPVLYGSINFSVGVQDPYFYGANKLVRESEANHTVMATSIPLFLCPSDGGGGSPGWTGGVNYRVNLGTERWYVSTNGPLMGPLNQISASRTTDGLSNTVAMCEKLRGHVGQGPLNPRRDMVLGGKSLPFSVDESVSACRAASHASARFISSTGLTWFVGSLSQTCYNQILEPNSTTVDCYLSENTNPISGIVGARSNHPGGVNAMMADGSVRFVTNHVQRGVWMALGTRDGGEVVSAGDF